MSVYSCFWVRSRPPRNAVSSRGRRYRYNHGTVRLWLNNGVSKFLARRRGQLEEDFVSHAKARVPREHGRLTRRTSRLWGLRYHSLEILTPPKIPMPGTLNAGPETERLDTDAVSINVKVFKACCELCVVRHKVRRMNRHIDLSKITSHQHEVAEQASQQLLGCANALPLELVRSNQSTHAVIMMQYGTTRSAIPTRPSKH